MNRFKQVLCCLAAVMAVPMLFAAEPTISLTATPRYPWNGLVDLAFTIEGDEGAKYDTMFSVQDVVGGTNLAMKTVYKSPGVKANAGVEKLVPGSYNWLWDAPVDLTSLRPMYSGCVPASSTVLFKNSRLDEIDEFHAVPCGTSVSDKFNTSTGGHIKGDGGGKSIQFAFSDDVYTKCVCMHFEQSGADVVGYAKWAKYVSGTGREGEDFDSNSATSQTIATSETAKGYGLCKIEARIPQRESSLVLDRVVIDAKVGDAITYSVKFNANGGTGSMANETFESGVAKALTANAFTRTGYTFQGWATTSTGAVVYSNRQSVTDLTTTAGGVVTLYAVWKSHLYMVIDISGGTKATSYPISYLDAVPSGGWTDTYKTSRLVLRRCEAGTYTMGTPKANDSRGIETQHKVTLTKAFYISVFETTRKQWGLVMGTSDSGTLPKANIPWLKIRENQGWPGNSTVGSSSFMGRLRSKTGKTKIDLPTEAQWEYACRAGTTTLFSYGSNSANGNYMWYSSNSGGSLHAVGGKKPNPWGLYDMHGNAFEWCLDYWNNATYGSTAVTDPKGSTSYSNTGSGTRPRIRRGGYFGGSGIDLSSSHRAYGSTDSYYNESVYLTGFRVVLTAD